MILQSLAAYLPSLLIGFLLVYLVQRSWNMANLILSLFLSSGIGIGLTSCLFFWWCLVFGPGQGGYLLVEGLLLILLAGLLIWRQRRTKQPWLDVGAGIRISWFSLALVAVFCVALIAVMMSFKNFSFMFPQGTFDAYGIWNLRARFIYRDMLHWQEAFSPQLNWKLHADYPLLVPMSVVRGWVILGEETTRIPIFQSWIFALSMAGLLFAGLSRIRNASQAALGAITLLGLPTTTYFATMQTAEFPLAYYYLATIILILLYRETHETGTIGLAGLTAGLAAWTKNEGILFLAGVNIVLLAWFWKNKSLKHLITFLIGLLVPAVCVIVFKLWLASSNDLFSAQTLQGVLAKMMDAKRYEMIFSTFFEIVVRLGEWKSYILIFLLVYLILCWRGSGILSRVLPLVAILVITFAGYFCVYLITPHPLDWHLKYSADRLFFHLTPALLFVIFFATKTAEELFGIKLYKLNFHIHKS